MRKLLFAIALLLLIGPMARSQEQVKASFTIDFGNGVNPYKELGMFVLPDTKVPFELKYDYDDVKVHAKANKGNLCVAGADRWIWTTPSETGHYRIVFSKQGQDSMVFNCMVMEPFDKINNGQINDFQIGHYPDSDKPLYAKPVGLIEVQPLWMDVQLSPHFQVKDFLCKQNCDFPMYLVLNEKLLLKLEMLLEAFNTAGYPIKKFAIMSGYRTPYYNESIGNVAFSRHQFGDAADIFLDEDGDNYMDDLNGDGRSDRKDIEIFHGIIDKAQQQPENDKFVGGLGFYDKNSFRTGFVHVDVRGHVARWGH